MMDWTDRHCRFFHRLLSRRARLYTEMVTTGAVLHGERERLLGFSPEEHPVAVQLGGSDPDALAEAARVCEGFGYDEINLNVGCPSDRVQNGAFGACLMREPALVGASVAAMKRAVAVPVTVKCRLGVDEQDPEEALDRLVDAVAAAGADGVVVHARKAWLHGLSPKENRDVPPLDHERVFRLKRRLPELDVGINGGIGTVAAAAGFVARGLDGAMLGRAAYREPWRLLDVDPVLFGEEAPHPSAFDAALALEGYIARHLERGGRLSAVTRHVLGLFQGVAGARSFRRLLAERAHGPGAGLDVWRAALALIRRDVLAAAA